MRGTDIAGKRFGRWLVLSRNGASKDRSALWACLCDCGIQKTVKASTLKDGSSKSCGCYGREVASAGCIKRLTLHGETVGKNSRIYRIWANMLSRCENEKFDSYKHYGARGIKVCDEWHSFIRFLSDMGRPSVDQSIDRIDPNGNYSPENCRWASKSTQMNNKRNNVFLEIDGVRKTVAQWSLEPESVKAKTIYHRIKKGWDHKSAVFEV